MAKWAKNTDIVDNIWAGMTVPAGTYYQLEDGEDTRWANDAQVITDIGNGKLVIAQDDTGNTDITDAALAVKYLLDKLIEIDDEGRQTVRRATAKKGWHYSAIVAEIKTSTVEMYNKDFEGNDLGYITIKLYDNSDVEITDPANYINCVKTVVNIAPDFDFEVIQGDIYHSIRPTQDVRLWTLAGITELGAAGAKVFVNGLNLKYMSPDDHIKSDGRSSKFMSKDITGLPYQGNQFQFILKHPAGYEHELMVVLDIYKA